MLREWFQSLPITSQDFIVITVSLFGSIAITSVIMYIGDEIISYRNKLLDKRHHK